LKFAREFFSNFSLLGLKFAPKKKSLDLGMAGRVGLR
jgi:hypothetical protein